MAPPLNTFMRTGFRQRETLDYLITLIGRAKKGLHVLRCPVFTENISRPYSEEQKKVYTSSDVQFFTESIGEEKKKVFIVNDRHSVPLPIFYFAPIFSEDLGFSFLSLYVNPALCLQSIFSLSPVMWHVQFMGASDPRFLLLISVPPTPQTKF